MDTVHPLPEACQALSQPRRRRSRTLRRLLLPLFGAIPLQKQCRPLQAVLSPLRVVPCVLGSRRVVRAITTPPSRGTPAWKRRHADRRRSPDGCSGSGASAPCQPCWKRWRRSGCGGWLTSYSHDTALCESSQAPTPEPERSAPGSHCFEIHVLARTRKSPPSADLLLSGAPRFLGGLFLGDRANSDFGRYCPFDGDSLPCTAPAIPKLVWANVPGSADLAECSSCTVVYHGNRTPTEGGAPPSWLAKHWRVHCGNSGRVGLPSFPTSDHIRGLRP